MGLPVIDILMYHSISEAGGPTSIPPRIFAAQMEAIAGAGVPVITLDDLLAARAGRKALPRRSVILTFDDGFADFADAAWPVLDRLRFPAIVYLPTDHVGRREAWRGANVPPRPLMSWAVIRDLAQAGVGFGSHTVSHPDLSALPPDALEAELAISRRRIEDKLARPVRHFAPPYGRSSPAVQQAIRAHYATSVGTGLGQAGAESDLLHLPRLEMFYFREAAAWRRHLSGWGAPYLGLRRALRAVRDLTSRPWERA